MRQQQHYTTPTRPTKQPDWPEPPDSKLCSECKRPLKKIEMKHDTCDECYWGIIDGTCRVVEASKAKI